MKRFYIETDQLKISSGQALRFVCEERSDDEIFLMEVVDVKKGDKMSSEYLKKNADPTNLLSWQTAYKANYTRHYF